MPDNTLTPGEIADLKQFAINASINITRSKPSSSAAIGNQPPKDPTVEEVIVGAEKIFNFLTK